MTHSPVILFSVCRWSWAIVWCPPIMVCSSVQCILRIRVCITAWPQRMASSAHLLKSVSRFWAAALVSALSNKHSPWGWAASLHPKALVSAFSPAETLAMHQYCKERKQMQSLQNIQSPMRGDLGKLKPLLDHRKSRNRRNHLQVE